MFVLEKLSKNLNFESFFLPLIAPLVATLNETRASTSRIYVAKQCTAMSN